MLRRHTASRRASALLAFVLLFGVTAAIPAGVAQTNMAKSGVQVTPNEAARRVDITIDGKPFTSYVWPETVKKPVLNPLQKKMLEQRDRLKLPDFFSDVKVENGELIVKQK